MKAITLEDLKAKFVVAKVVPYGEVIMVPGGDFDPDWEDTLEEEGFGCVFTEINNEKFTLVKLEKDEGEEESTAEPSGKHRGAPPGRKVNHWSDADAERLLKRIEEMPRTTTFEDKCVQLVSEFPGRTATGLEKKYLKLKRLEKSKSRQRVGRLKKEVPSGVKQILKDASIPKEPVSWVDAAAKLDIVKMLAGLEDRLTGFLELVKVQNIVLMRLHCAVVMQALETHVQRGILTIPPSLRDHYVQAITSTSDKEPIDVFLEKARLLVEASK